MNWLFPAFFAGTLLIGLPVLLHFLRGRPKTIVPFPSLRFLGASAIRDTRRHKIQRWITLLLRCLFIAALAAAFARPFLDSAAARHRHLMVIAIDNSMSMQARGRWEASRSQALAKLARLGPGDRAALLLMFPRPIWAVPMTEDLGRVRSALAGAVPGFEKTRYAPALQTATGVLASTPAAERTLVWMADEQRTGWLGVDLSRPLPAGIKLEAGDSFAQPASQAAITRLQRDGARLVATVRLYSTDKNHREIILESGGREFARQSVELEPGENSIPLTLPPDIPFLRVTLSPSDDLPADDSAWFVLGQTTGNTVLLDTAQGPDFVGHALQSSKKFDAGGLDTAPVPPGNWPPGSPVILREARSFLSSRTSDLNRFFDAGGPLFLFIDGSDAQTTWLAARGVKATPRHSGNESWNLRDWDAEHPILAAYAGQSLLPLLQVDFYRGFNLEGDQLTPIANWPDGRMALAEWNNRGSRALIAGFPMTRADTNWTTHPSFVPFIHQAVTWLGSFAMTGQNWHVGDVIALPPGSGTWGSLDAPIPTPPRAAAGSVRPDIPGVYEFSTGAKRQLFAVNTPPEESDLAPWPDPTQLQALSNPAATVDGTAQADTATAQAPAEFSENRQQLWWWIMALGGLVLLAELALANRTAL